jgi:cell division protein FtsL
MQTLNLAAAFFALSSAFLLYGLNYETRQIEGRVQAAERAAERARGDIAVFRAERAHLSRPERIETFARAQGLEPARKSQFIADRLADVAEPAGQ